VFERQIVLDIAANDLTAAAASYAKTKAIWESVKPSVLTHSGQQSVAKFEASLAKQDAALQAKDVSALTAEANNGLEIVDELEKLYRQGS
jgi:tRNA threonylcarbamoyladenosine modification (KEOPS) complex  Pcc1 subunit